MISRALKTVFKKEVMENLRDKRTVMNSLIMSAGSQKHRLHRLSILRVR